MNDSTREPHERQQDVLTVTVPGRDDHLDLVSLGAGEIPEHVITALEGAPDAPTADVTAWFARPTEDAMAAAVAAVELHDAAPRLRFAVSGEIHPRPFEAALAAMPSAADTAAIARGRRTATWLASRLPQPEHEAAANLLASRLRDHGLKGLKVAEVLKQVRLDAASVDRDDADAAPAAGSFMDLPAGAAGLLVPPGYRLRPEGVVRLVRSEEGAREALVTATPMLVVRRGRDVETGVMTLALLCRLRGAWTEIEFPRQDLFDTRGVLGLGGFGPFVDANNCRDVIRYLSSCEAANDDRLITEHCTSGLGWVGGRPEQGFVFPDRHVTGPADAGRVRLRSPGGGFDQLLAAVQPGGSFDDWRAAIARLDSLPAVRFALLGSLAAPLLAVLGVPGFTILLSCATSRGKTTALRVAASVWGRPHESGPSLINPMHCTRPWLERAAAFLGGLPVLLDDTMKLGRAEELEKILYDFDGRGRGRATKCGLARTASFQTIALLSGESGLTDFTEAGGAWARVLQLRVPPFGDETAENAALAQGTAAVMEAHHGHAGPRWVQWVVAHDHEWEDWQVRLEAIRARYTTGVSGGPAFRLARHLAVLRLTDELVMECGLLPFVDGRDVVGELLPAVLAAAADADRASAALQVVVEHAVSNPSLYLTAESGGRQASKVGSHGGLWGRWSSDRTDWRLAVVPGRMREILLAAGHRYDGTLEAWRSKGWLVADGDRQGLKKVRLGENSLRCVALARHAVDPLVESGVDRLPAP